MKPAAWAAAIVVILAAAALAVWWQRPSIDPARIRTACAQYAGLDLAGWASICRDAGYQQGETDG